MSATILSKFEIVKILNDVEFEQKRLNDRDVESRTTIIKKTKREN